MCLHLTFYAGKLNSPAFAASVYRVELGSHKLTKVLHLPGLLWDRIKMQLLCHHATVMKQL